MDLLPLILDAADDLFVTDGVVCELDEPEVDPGHGALYTWATLCIDGVYEYLEKQPDGSLKKVREWNSPAAVRDMAALAPRAPVTHLHPRERVTPHNIARYSIGDAASDGITVEGAEETGPNGSSYKRLRAMVPLAIRTAKGQERATTDAKYCSPGYQPIREDSAGVHPLDGPYDRVRVGVLWVNHNALVPNPRGGLECGLALDGLDDTEIQAALDATAPMGYAVAEHLNVRSVSLPPARRVVKQKLQEDSMTPTAAELQALFEKMLKVSEGSDDELRSLFDTLSWTSAFRKLQMQMLLEMLGAATPVGAATDATPAMDSLVRGALDAWMKPTTDAMAEMRTFNENLKAENDALKLRMDALEELVKGKGTANDAKLLAIDSQITLISADAKIAKDTAATASQIAGMAKDSADAVKAATEQQMAQDAATASTATLADARTSAAALGMAKDAADKADLAACVAHLRAKRLDGVRDSDSDSDVLAIARARRSNRSGISSRAPVKLVIDAASGALG